MLRKRLWLKLVSLFGHALTLTKPRGLVVVVMVRDGHSIRLFSPDADHDVGTTIRIAGGTSWTSF